MPGEINATARPFDLTMRHLAQGYPKDIVRLCLGQEPQALEVLSPDLTATERRADSLAKVNVSGEIFGLQVEFQTRYAKGKALGTLEYRVRARVLRGLPVLSVVVYLTDEGYPGPGSNVWEEKVLDRTQLVFQFEDVRLWELDASRFLEAGIDGLVPLAVLMCGGDNEETLRRAVEATAKVSDNSRRKDLEAAIAVLGSLKYSEEAIWSLIRREAMKESSMVKELFEEVRKEGFQQGREEGREKGREKGREEGQRTALREHVLKTLSRRFSVVSSGIANALTSEDSQSNLERLVDLAYTAKDIDDFRRGLGA
ncbi:MAG: Rpn family recombination-promoting nuclease/putative transposase [Planctomycetes bacterium]|nr:Rpn family recombination-promoting nuclease/putative transposase [Planctomycetota bacterium]